MEAVTTTRPTAAGSAKLYLASQSPRRRELLTSAGFEFACVNPPMDDGHLESGHVEPRRWVEALAYLKARAVETVLSSRGCGGIVLGADTVVLANNQILGKPDNEQHAREMIRSLSPGKHQVLTGVSLVWIDQPRRLLLSDAASVTFGTISSDLIDQYIASGAWRGKAGGYNIQELQVAGWPVEFSGDVGTIMGLPMQRLVPMLREMLNETVHGARR